MARGAAEQKNGRTAISAIVIWVKKNRLSILSVGRIERRCASGKRRCAMHASKSSCKHVSADGKAVP